MIKIKYFLSICIVVILCLSYLYFYPGTRFLQRDKTDDNDNSMPPAVNSALRTRNETMLKELQNIKKVDDWFQHIRKHDTFTINNQKLYVFCYEALDKDGQKFQLRVHYDPKYENMMWEDIFASQQENFVFVREVTDKDLIKNMYSLSKKGNHIMRYYWTDPITHTLTSKQAIVENWEKDGRSGILGIGYTMRDLSKTNKIKYQDYVNPFVSICYLILTGIVSILLIRKSIFIGILFFLLSITGFIIYVGMEEFKGSAKSENDKTISMNSMILSISFLLGVNLFILRSLSGDKPRSVKTFSEISILFCSSLVLVLGSILYFSSSNDVSQLMQNRISKQLMFILAVILNVCIIVAFFIHLFHERKMWSLTHKANVTKHKKITVTDKSLNL
ncbi:MAG: hypothetical protein CMM15_15080 [Rhodospirillaceae bacterium]|nr:hypothetical protein [Rhodospirillaceae bacterium]